MHLTVLGATGATGGHLVRQALERGHMVTAVARDPSRITVTDPGGRLVRVAADVRDTAGIARALHGSEVVLSGLGITGREPPGVLTAGARAAVAAHPARIVWLGAYGTGASAQAAGALTRTLLRRFLGAQLDDKVTADTAVLDAGGIVFHAGPLSDGPLARDRRTVALAQAPRRLFPARVSRATTAAAMLDAAEASGLTPGTYLPLQKPCR